MEHGFDAARRAAEAKIRGSGRSKSAAERTCPTDVNHGDLVMTFEIWLAVILFLLFGPAAVLVILRRATGRWSGESMLVAYKDGKVVLWCPCGFASTAATLECAGRQMDVHLAAKFPKPSERRPCDPPDADRAVIHGPTIRI